MVSKELLEMLVCPETKQPVALADEGLLAKLNERIRSGGTRTTGGKTVEKPVESGLVREDGTILYPVVDDIPIMLFEEAILLEAGTPTGG